MFAPEQHDLYDGHFVLSAGRIHMVGGLNDPEGWDHMDNDAKSVKPVAGTVELDVNDLTNTGTFEARLKIPEGNLVLAIDRFNEFSPCQQGGIVAFQEFDYTSLIAVPQSPLYDQLADWWRQTARQAGIELQMGFKLFSAYQTAGLPGPNMHGETILGGGPDFAGYDYLAGIFRSVVPLMERFGVATAAEVDVDTLAERLRADRVASGRVVALQMIVGATARKP